MHILTLLTSPAEWGATGRKTGFWPEELAAPCYSFLAAGAAVVFASPAGGRPPVDRASEAPRRTDRLHPPLPGGPHGPGGAGASRTGQWRRRVIGA